MVMHVMIFLPPMLIALAVMFRAGTGALMHRGMSPNWSVPSGASEDDDGPGKTT
jgi:hypothetical protein